MLDANDRRFIEEQIKKSMNVILSGQTLASDGDFETIQKLFADMPNIQKRPLMQPYGLASKAPDGTLQIVGRQGEHFGNRIILGHRDAKRPKDIKAGEVVLYNQFGQKIYIKEKKMQFGTQTSDENMVLGKVLADFITKFLRAILDAPQIGQTILGPAWLDPDLRTQFEEFLVKYVQDPETNILSKMCFTERGELAGG